VQRPAPVHLAPDADQGQAAVPAFAPAPVVGPGPHGLHAPARLLLASRCSPLCAPPGPATLKGRRGQGEGDRSIPRSHPSGLPRCPRPVRAQDRRRHARSYRQPVRRPAHVAHPGSSLEPLNHDRQPLTPSCYFRCPAFSARHRSLHRPPVAGRASQAGHARAAGRPRRPRPVVRGLILLLRRCGWGCQTDATALSRLAGSGRSTFCSSGWHRSCRRSSPRRPCRRLLGRRFTRRRRPAASMLSTCPSGRCCRRWRFTPTCSSSRRSSASCARRCSRALSPRSSVGVRTQPVPGSSRRRLTPLPPVPNSRRGDGPAQDCQRRPAPACARSRQRYDRRVVPPPLFSLDLNESDSCECHGSRTPVSGLAFGKREQHDYRGSAQMPRRS
jgi:hypothetical protein